MCAKPSCSEPPARPLLAAVGWVVEGGSGSVCGVCGAVCLCVCVWVSVVCGCGVDVGMWVCGCVVCGVWWVGGREGGGGSDLCVRRVSLHTRRRSMQQIRVPGHLGVNSRRPGHPFSALMAGVKPWPCACEQPLPTHPEQASLNLLDLHNRDVDHLVYELYRLLEQSRPREPASAP